MRSQRFTGHSLQGSGHPQREVDLVRAFEMLASALLLMRFPCQAADVASTQETKPQQTSNMVSCDVQGPIATLSASTFPCLTTGRLVLSDDITNQTNKACFYWARLGMCPKGNGCKDGHDEGVRISTAKS